MKNQKNSIVFFTLIFMLFGCKSNNTIINNYDLGVVLTTDVREKSKVIYFNQNLEILGDRELKYAGLGTHFSQPTYYNGKMYLIPAGITVKLDERKTIEVDLKTNEIKEYHVDKINIQRVTVNDNNIFTSSNLNGIYYLTQTDKENNFIKELQYENSKISMIVCVKDKLCVFGIENDFEQSKKNNSWIKIYDMNLNIIKDINITELGDSQIKYCVKDNLLYFSNSVKNNENNNSIGVLNIEDYSIEEIKLNTTNPSDLLIYKDCLFVAHTSEVILEGNVISKVSLADYNFIEEFTLDCNIERMERNGDYLYIMGNKDGVSVLRKYDLSNKMNMLKSIDIDTKKDLYTSVLFVDDY